MFDLNRKNVINFRLRLGTCKYYPFNPHQRTVHSKIELTMTRQREDLITHAQGERFNKNYSIHEKLLKIPAEAVKDDDKN